MEYPYGEDDLLPLSGIQHFAFCRRQWALIHIDRRWEENGLTASGRVLHERVHNGPLREKRGGIITCRQLRIVTYRYGFQGVCDAVEWRQSETGMTLPGEQGYWQCYPVEYKRGHPKKRDEDRLQLALEALALEEMLEYPVRKAALYYGKERRRTELIIDEDLLAQLDRYSREMHDYLRQHYVPKVKPSKACHSCSLLNFCMPETQDKNVATYYQSHLNLLEKETSHEEASQYTLS